METVCIGSAIQFVMKHRMDKIRQDFVKLTALLGDLTPKIKIIYVFQDVQILRLCIMPKTLVIHASRQRIAQLIQLKHMLKTQLKNV
jgi:hypothetical protein